MKSKEACIAIAIRNFSSASLLTVHIWEFISNKKLASGLVHDWIVLEILVSFVCSATHLKCTLYCSWWCRPWHYGAGHWGEEGMGGLKWLLFQLQLLPDALEPQDEIKNVLKRGRSLHTCWARHWFPLNTKVWYPAPPKITVWFVFLCLRFKGGRGGAGGGGVIWLTTYASN